MTWSMNSVTVDWDDRDGGLAFALDSLELICGGLEVPPGSVTMMTVGTIYLKIDINGKKQFDIY